MKLVTFRNFYKESRIYFIVIMINMYNMFFSYKLIKLQGKCFIFLANKIKNKKIKKSLLVILSTSFRKEFELVALISHGMMPYFII